MGDGARAARAARAGYDRRLDLDFASQDDVRAKLPSLANRVGTAFACHAGRVTLLGRCRPELSRDHGGVDSAG